jgi:hypothetical protein
MHRNSNSFPRTSLLAALPMLLLSTAAGATSPSTLPLPAGWQPEGITAGPAHTVFVGSIPTGAIYQVDVRSGEGRVAVPAQDGRAAIGIEWDRRSDNLFVAGGPTGRAFVYNATTGENLADLQATLAEVTFVNDVVVTPHAAYFTDSYRPSLYRLALECGGGLPPSPVLEEIPLGGDFESVPGEFNANGIEAVHGGRHLVVVNSALGTLYRVDPDTGDASLINLGVDSVAMGDGLFLRGGKLYVVQNFLNQIAVVKIDGGLRSGSVVELLTNDALDIPTTVTAVGASLYAVNARFATPPAPDTEYDVVRLPLHPGESGD